MRALQTYSSTVAPRYHHIKVLAARAGYDTTSETLRALANDAPVRGDVLDLGCGDGQLLLGLSRKSEVTSISGIDMDPTAIRAALEAAPLAFHDLRVGNVAECAYPLETFDTILLDPTFLLYFDAVHVLDRVYPWLRPHGALVLYAGREGEAEFQEFLRLHRLDEERVRRGAAVAVCSVFRDELAGLRSPDHFDALRASTEECAARGRSVEDARTFVGRVVLRSGRRRQRFPALPNDLQRFLSMLPLTYAPAHGERAKWSISEALTSVLPSHAFTTPRAFVESLPYVDRGLSFAPRLTEPYTFERFHRDRYDIASIRSFMSADGRWFTVKRRRRPAVPTDPLRATGLPTPRTHGQLQIGGEFYAFSDEWRTHVTWATTQRWADLFGLDAESIHAGIRASLRRYQPLLKSTGASSDATSPRNVLVRWDYEANMPHYSDIGFIDFTD